MKHCGITDHNVVDNDGNKSVVSLADAARSRYIFMTEDRL